MRKYHHPISWLVLLLILSLLAGTAAAEGPPQSILRHVIASGGQRVAAGPLILNGTVGQPVVGTLALAGGYKLAHGYWWVMARSSRLYLPVIVH
jgi:hypothetical protein